MKKDFWKLIFLMTFQQFMLALVNAADAWMLGKLNQDALSAVSLATQVSFVWGLFVGAFGMGTNMFAAQYWGKGDKESVEKVMAFVMRSVCCVAMIFCFTSMFTPKILMQIFTNDVKLIALGAQYLEVVGISYFLSGIAQVYLSILKNTGHAGKSMLISSMTVVLNIVLNMVLIFGIGNIPAQGIAGAALATVIANAAGLAWVVIESFRKDSLRPAVSCFSLHISSLEKRFWKYATPGMLNLMAWGIGFTMYSVVMGHLGSDAVAANSIANITKNLVVCFCMGLGNGGSIVIGNELGAGHLEKAKKDGAYLCKMAIAAGAVTGVFLLAISPLILHFANISPQARTYLKYMLIMGVYYMIGKSINCMTVGGIFCAGGDSKFGLICDSITLWCITIPIGTFAAFVLHAPVLVVYFLLNLDEVIKLPVVYWHYKKYRWVRNLTELEDGSIC